MSATNRPLIVILDDDNTQVHVPQRWEICDRCEGHGQHVHPAISVPSQDMREDSEAMENYFAGRYDVCCDECHGSGKQLVPDWGKTDDQDAPTDPRLALAYHQLCADARESRETAAIYASERAMGA